MSTKDMSSEDERAVSLVCHGFLEVMRRAPSFLAEYQESIAVLDQKCEASQKAYDAMDSTLQAALDAVSAKVTAYRASLMKEAESLQRDLAAKTEDARQALQQMQDDLVIAQQKASDRQDEAKRSYMKLRDDQDVDLENANKQLLDVRKQIEAAQRARNQLLDDIAAMKKKWSS